MSHQTERLAREASGNQDAEALYSEPNTELTGDRLALYRKLFKLQGEVGKISKDLTNPFFSSKYFDINKLLDHLIPYLQECGLLVIQPVRDGIVFSKVIDVDTGEFIESNIPLPANTDPQKMGMAVSYYRRYTLTSLLSLQAEDDDGNSVSTQGRSKTKGSKPKGSSKNSPKQSEVSDDDKKWLNENTKHWTNAVEKVSSGELKAYDLRDYYKVSNDSMEYFLTLEDEAGNEAPQTEIDNSELPFA